MTLLRGLARIGISFVAVGVLALVLLQFVRVVRHNVVLVHDLGAVRRDVGDLERKRVAQERTIRRLRDPLGAVPEIHERLRLVRPNEAIIYLEGPGAPAAPAP